MLIDFLTLKVSTMLVSHSTLMKKYSLLCEENYNAQKINETPCLECFSAVFKFGVRKGQREQRKILCFS